ncbi:hypothetical protein ACUNV4_16410 [Granulosicoccus sp. 3-233]|uniref:hypothetical protein n=1 Tax=Granulosicoccus sp. 3-233 TaxID=3417969 RepID=UPI003D34ED20
MTSTEPSPDEIAARKPRNALEESTWWWLSGLVTLVLAALLCAAWISMSHYESEPLQLTNQETLDNFLTENMKPVDQGIAQPVRVPTGLFLQSMKFLSSTEVSVSGYLWQRYTDGTNDQIKPAPGAAAGFILPDQVDSGADINPREVYRIRQGKEEVIGWYFEANLRQPFDYSRYPFDHKTVWVHLWPRDFAGNVVLTPDFAAYSSTGSEAMFGIDKDIVLGTWVRENTYFDYKLSSYDTNFGIDNFVGQTDFPDLRYNVVVKRKSANAFIVYLLPLFLVAALLFSTLLIVTARPKLVARHGFSTSGSLGTCAALFFVVLLAHVQLREQFAGSGIVYLERFYLLMYASLALAAVNTYLFSVHAGRWLTIVHYRDNLFPKLLYWPVTLACMVVITAVSM